jgi:hypothetical protein
MGGCVTHISKSEMWDIRQAHAKGRRKKIAPLWSMAA